MAKRPFAITDEEIRAACYWRNIRKVLERIDKKLDAQLRPKRRKPKTSHNEFN